MKENCPLFNKSSGFFFYVKRFRLLSSLNFILQTQDLTAFSTSLRSAFRCSFLPCAPRNELLLVSVVAVACRPFGFPFLVWRFFAPATLCRLFSRRISLHVCSLFSSCEDCCCMLCSSVYKSQRLGVCWSLKMFRPSCYFGSSTLGGYNRTNGRASWSVPKCLVQCGVESTED